MHKDFLDKLVEHSNGQLVEVLIFVNQSDKTVSVLFVLLIALDSLFQNRDFSGKLGLFLFVLSVQSGVSAVGQLSYNVVLIDFAEQDFQLGHSLLCGGKAYPLFLMATAGVLRRSSTLTPIPPPPARTRTLS